MWKSSTNLLVVVVGNIPFGKSCFALAILYDVVSPSGADEEEETNLDEDEAYHRRSSGRLQVTFSMRVTADRSFRRI